MYVESYHAVCHRRIRLAFPNEGSSSLASQELFNETYLAVGFYLRGSAAPGTLVMCLAVHVCYRFDGGSSHGGSSHDMEGQAKSFICEATRFCFVSLS